MLKKYPFLILAIAASLVGAAHARASAPSNAALNERLERLELSQEAEATANERQDLEAQVSMAKSARDMIILTWIQVVIGIAGTGGLIATLWFTTKSFNLLRSSTTAQLQPYLTVSGLAFLQEEDQRLRATHTIKNNGQTSAREVKVSLGFTIGPARSIELEGPYGPTDLAPGQEIKVFRHIDRELSNDDLQQIHSSREYESTLTTRVKITYVDAFGGRHQLDKLWDNCGPEMNISRLIEDDWHHKSPI